MASTYMCDMVYQANEIPHVTVYQGRESAHMCDMIYQGRENPHMCVMVYLGRENPHMCDIIY